jgi:Na+/H+ antiporter NhaD/arsenite permease-like protein
MQLQAAIIILVFFLTYVGMAAGRLPWLQVDRTGIALLGVIALLATESVTLDDLGTHIDTSTLVLLFALMIVSAQFLSSGFYDRCAEWVTGRRGGPAQLLATTVAVCGGLGALLANDIVVFTMAPLLVAGARARGLDPRPFLLGLACATNAGSAATLIGNPQNILIGQIGNLSFPTFLAVGLVPSIVALFCVFGVIWLLWHDRIEGTVLAVTREGAEVPVHPYDRNQTMKGIAAMAALLVIFMTPLPRETGGLVIAALLLATRKFTSRTMIAAVDWPLLLLFVCLFAITGVLNTKTLLPSAIMSSLQSANSLAVLTPVTLLMSNIFGNVPSVILLLNVWSDPPPGALYALGLLSSLAGNLLLVGSLSNLIVVEQGAAYGVRIDFAEYARAGVPITVLSMGFAVAWLAWTGWLPLWPGGAAP